VVRGVGEHGGVDLGDWLTGREPPPHGRRGDVVGRQIEDVIEERLPFGGREVEVGQRCGADRMALPRPGDDRRQREHAVVVVPAREQWQIVAADQEVERAIGELGDSGAYLLGIATSTVAARAAVLDPWALAAVAVPFLDFTQVVIARIALGLAPWVGDRRHLTHIVHHRGVPRWAIAPLFAAVAIGRVVGAAFVARTA